MDLVHLLLLDLPSGTIYLNICKCSWTFNRQFQASAKNIPVCTVLKVIPQRIRNSCVCVLYKFIIYTTLVNFNYIKTATLYAALNELMKWNSTELCFMYWFLFRRHLQTKYEGVNKIQQLMKNLRTSIFGLNGSICATSGLGSFDNSASTSASGKLFAESELVDRWTFCDCWNKSCTKTHNELNMKTVLHIVSVF